jgi:hypothetical protein
VTSSEKSENRLSGSKISLVMEEEQLGFLCYRNILLAEASHGQSGRRLLAESKPAPIRIVPVRKQTENFQ